MPIRSRSEPSPVEDRGETGGWVYVLSHPYAWNSAVKIGKTRHDPAIRAGQITSASGLIEDAKVEWACWVADRHTTERAAHERLQHYRVSRRREMFAVTVADARAAIEAVSGNPRVDPSVREAALNEQRRRSAEAFATPQQPSGLIPMMGFMTYQDIDPPLRTNATYPHDLEPPPPGFYDPPPATPSVPEPEGIGYRAIYIDPSDRLADREPRLDRVRRVLLSLPIAAAVLALALVGFSLLH